MKYTPEADKVSLFAIVINLIQIISMAAVVLYLLLGGAEGRRIPTGVVVAACGASVLGAALDIWDALQTRRRERTITGLSRTNDQMDALNLKLRAQRHDFLNHIQVVYSLLEMNEPEEASAYLERIYKELHSVSKVMRTKLAAFNALLQVKNAACEEKGIAFEMDISSSLEELPMPPWELCAVIGNLIDNAMDALADTPSPRIRLSVGQDLRGFSFTVSNNGPLISSEMRERIFESGVSSKGEGRGMGLSIVRKTLAEYGGTITLADADEVCFSVFVPKKENGTV